MYFIGSSPTRIMELLLVVSVHIAKELGTNPYKYTQARNDF